MGNTTETPFKARRLVNKPAARLPKKLSVNPILKYRSVTTTYIWHSSWALWSTPRSHVFHHLFSCNVAMIDSANLLWASLSHVQLLFIVRMMEFIVLLKKLKAIA